ncbi:uncharacterized protein IUM83_12821 [Phytophthora cinnamomi]|uniref:uncharacterized protein n=1 Tax=Phytophthora cinnamomi TaxID=4785 RepID=UPI00355A7C80|nr:hypothetical protein IUM83_12821 [Phytophthora cinnamomi]
MDGGSRLASPSTSDFEEKVSAPDTKVSKYEVEERKVDETVNDAETQLLSFTTSPRATWTPANLEVNGRPVISLSDRGAAEADSVITKRYYTKQKDMKYDPTVRSSPDALAESWSVFVESMVKDEDGWMRAFINVKSAFMSYNIEGDKIRVHELSVAEEVPCWVLTEQRCPMCYLDSPKATGIVRRGEVGNISPELGRLVTRLDSHWSYQSRLAAEGKERRRMMQTDVTDNIPLAQVGQFEADQRIRYIETNVFSRVCLVNKFEEL